jgi:CubicO group peptidase (beta-lactamase class C family)
VKLVDDIRMYIPELHKFDHTITVDHLLHHTSGLRDWPGTLSVGGWRFDDVISFNQILTMAYNQRELNFVPGAEYLYSNTGYNVLAEMVQRVTGKSFRAFTDSVLFRPLGMMDSHFHDDHTELTPNRAFGYARAPDGTFRSTPNALTALGSSSLFSSVDDLVKWVVNFDSAKVGGKAAMELMRTRGTFNDGKSNPYAFGITHGEFRGVPMINHSGSWASFSTFVMYFPSQKLGIVALANGGGINAGAAANQLASIYLDGALAAAPVAAPSLATVVNVPSAMLDQYVGLYKLGPGWYTRIGREGTSLTSTATNEGAAPMTARSESEFWIPNYNASMSFKRDSAGKIAYLEYRGQRAPRMTETSSAAPKSLADYAGDYESAELGTTYRVVVKNGALEVQHPRHGNMPLTWLTREEFGSSAWFMKALEFTRDRRGRVAGFVVNGDARSRNIRFEKRR